MQSYHFIVNMIPKSKLFIIHQYNIHIGIWILSYALHISTIHSTVTVNNVQEIILKSLIINNFLENYSYNHSLFCFVFLPYCLYSYCCLQKKNTNFLGFRLSRRFLFLDERRVLLKVNHPFLLFIYDPVNNLNLFMATIITT